MTRSLWLRLIRWLAWRLPVRRIYGEDSSLYLERFKLFGWMPGDKRLWPCSLYLHRFHRPDMEDPGVVHTHPWKWSVSLVLTGGYTEERLAQGLYSRVLLMVRRRPFRLNIFRAGDAHRVAKLHGEVWTLFLVGPKTSSWGFIVPGRGFVPWRERLEERNIPL